MSTIAVASQALAQMNHHQFVVRIEPRVQKTWDSVRMLLDVRWDLALRIGGQHHVPSRR
jgi:hypothetical protein